jgi:hypothetical protein
MISKKIWGLLIAKVSLVTIATSSFFTYQYHIPIKRAVNNLLHDDITVEENFYRDPNGLYVQTSINEDGNKEVYLVHGPTQTRYGIQSDMLPSSENMLDGILQRSMNCSSEDAKKQLQVINTIEDMLYRRVEW